MHDQAAFEAVLRRFNQLWSFLGKVEPIVQERELRAAIAALGVTPRAITEAWFHSLDPDWVFGMSDGPYAQEELNRRYRRLLDETPDTRWDHGHAA